MVSHEIPNVAPFRIIPSFLICTNNWTKDFVHYQIWLFFLIGKAILIKRGFLIINTQREAILLQDRTNHMEFKFSSLTNKQTNKQKKSKTTPPKQTPPSKTKTKQNKTKTNKQNRTSKQATYLSLLNTWVIQ